MKKLDSPIKTGAVLIFAVLSLTFVIETECFAQRSRPIAVERRIERLNRQIMDDERDDLARDMKRGKNRSSERVNAQIKLEQVRKDFTEIQSGYNRIVLALADKQNFGYASISTAVEEVNKRAVRLKENLALPSAQADQEKDKLQSEAAPIDFRKSVLILEKHIYNFVTNPLFEAPDVLDLELAGKAARDLDKIIELSEYIKQNGDKTPSPSQR